MAKMGRPLSKVRTVIYYRRVAPWLVEPLDKFLAGYDAYGVAIEKLEACQPASVNPYDPMTGILKENELLRQRVLELERMLLG